MTPKDTGTAVPEGFRLPHNTSWSMADAWGLSASELEAARDRDKLARSAAAKRGADALAAKRRKKFVEDYHKRKNLTKAGKVAFAGYDASEVM